MKRSCSVPWTSAMRCVLKKYITASWPVSPCDARYVAINMVCRLVREQQGAHMSSHLVLHESVGCQYNFVLQACAAGS